MAKVVIKRNEWISGSAMEVKKGIRDWKVIYPETGFPVKTLVLGVVEVEPNNSTPLHKHNCEEVYYILEGHGVLEISNEKYEVGPGDAVYIKENTPHRIINNGKNVLRYVAVAGIMLVPLLPKWPTESPYEILENPK
jgi:mannose-6-phosphate isomerase-like protein (cupin superfamily)